MQLILTHADLEAALINDLRNKGMTAFEPGKASVDFSFKRGTKELICTLDTEAKAPVETGIPAPKPDALSPTQTEATSAPAVMTQDTAQAVVAANTAQVAEAQPEAPADTTTEVAGQAEPAAAGSDDDNLFD